MSTWLRLNHQYVEPSTAPAQPAAGDDPRDAQIADLRAKVTEQRAELSRLSRAYDQVVAGGPVEELLRARQTLQRQEDLLAVYEGRPSPVDCPRACCAPATVRRTGSADDTDTIEQLAAVVRREDQ